MGFKRFNTALYESERRLARYYLVVPEKLPHFRIDPKMMEIVNVFEPERSQK
jgi:hypothetical protein